MKLQVYKKTNLEDFFVKEADNFVIVIENSYNEVEVLYKDKILKTKLAKHFHGNSNQLIYTGDKVVLSEDYFIDKIIQRKNILCREKFDSTRRSNIGVQKIVATNIDLAVIVVSAYSPPLHPKFIDRYLILLKSNPIPFIIVLNKCDLKTEKDQQILNIYKELGIPVLETSTTLNIGIKKLKEYLKNKQTILVGHSGVGKSSLVNTLMETNDIKVGLVGEKTKKGRHTTTTSKLYKWEENSVIIDTPGIRSLDLKNFPLKEIQNYFPEMIKYKSKCKFTDCLHFEEPISGCYVKQKVQLNSIYKERYESYVKIIKELKK